MKTRVKLSFSLILTLALWLTMAQTAMAAITGSGTADDPYLISSTADWNTFASNVNGGTSYSGKTVKLDADISVTTMVGTYSNPFRGTFDGGGHTLNVTLNNNGQSGDGDQYYGVAPFRFTNDATIKYLRVAGTITTSTRKYAAGLIGMTISNTNTIKNCISSVEIYSTINGDGTHGGFIGKASGTVIIKNCLFNGQLTTTNSNTTTSCGGFVGWKDGTLTITNCLYAPATTIPSGKIAVSSESSSTFSRNNVTPTNSYYTQTLGTAQGTAVGSKTAAQLVTALGGGWKVSSNKAVPILSVASITISSTTEWNNFATRVNNGEDEINVTLTKSITVSSMVGTDAHPFCGTFDGGTNTITADITGTTEAAALFRYISGATIKRLTVAGSISGGIHCAGLVGYAADNSNNLIEKVTVRAAITTNGTHCGGIIGHGKKSTTTIKDCIFSGSISGGTHVGVLWGWSDSNCKPTIQNCLENGSSYTGTNVNPVGLISNWGTVTNTYYLHTTKGTPNQNTTRGIRLYNSALSEGVYCTLTAIDHQTYYAPVTISNIEETYSITGKAIFPEPKVTAADGTILTKGTHYNVAYSSSNDKTIGNYSLTVTGISPYAGSQTINYSVIAATLTDTWFIDGGMNGGSQCNYSNTDKVADVSSNGKTMHFKWTNGAEHTFYWSTWGMGGVAFDNPSSNQLVITFPDVKGIVSKVYFSKMVFRPSSVKMYIGNSKGRLSVANGDGYLEGHESGVPFSATLTGSVEVDENDPLKIWFEGEEVLSVDCPEATLNLMSQNQSPCNVKVTYTTTEIELGPEHTFSFPDPSTFSGNTLTLTCTNNDNDHECGLANRQAVLTLDMKDGKTGAANTATLNISDFIKQTGLTCSNGAITYYNHTKNQSYAFASWQGDYTVSVTVTVDGKQYTLTKDIQVVDPHHITNDCLALSIDKYMSEAWKDDEVTITYMPQTGMILSELTVKATTDLTIGHGITDNQDNTYTFVMPDEDVTIIPTFTFNIDENDFSQEGDTYTIKSAEGWGDFATLITYDETLNGFSGKTVKLGTSIGSSEMAGTSGHPFKGTFDGQGNTLTFNLQASKGHSAPFHYTDGATISNLHVEGTITGGDNTSLGGLVGYAVGNITIENCHVSTQISTTHSGAAWHGGVIAFWYDSNVACTVTGCVYDGLIYNPSEADATTYCRGFIGNLFGSNLTVTFTDCLYAPAAYGTGKNTLGDECNTFVYPNSSPTYNMTNCYYTSTLGNKQGRPAATTTVAPANLGDATTDHGIVKGYENGFLYDGNYYTPKYGDAVVEYRFNDWNERADVTINGTNNQGTGVNVVGVNITEEVGNIKSVTYNRPFNTAQAATVILPFSYICNGSEGGKFYGFKEVVYDENLHKWVCTMVEPGNTAVTTLTANTPYVFMPNDATTMTFPNISSMTGGVVTLLPTTANDGLYGGGTTDAAWNFHGSYKGKSWAVASNDYGFAAQSGTEAGGAATVEAGQFVRFTIGAFIKPMRCYLSYVGTEAPAPARGLTRSAAATDDLPQSITVRLVSRSGETTAIGTLDTKTGEVSFDSEAWYTLDGVRLSGKPSTKGIYINNGRKIVIK